MIDSFDFDPSAVRVVTVDWTKWPWPPGLRIASVTWAVPPVFKLIAQSITGMKANVKLDYVGPLVVGDFEVTCHMVTTDPQSPPLQDSRRVGLRVVPR